MLLASALGVGKGEAAEAAPFLLDQDRLFVFTVPRGGSRTGTQRGVATRLTLREKNSDTVNELGEKAETA
jgi:hypothetical protein